MRKYLKIAVTAEVKALVEEPWETVLLSAEILLLLKAFRTLSPNSWVVASNFKDLGSLFMPILRSLATLALTSGCPKE